MTDMGTKDSVKRSTCERDRSMSGRGRVALVRCDSYDSQQVERAVSKAIELLGGLEEILSSGEDPLTKASSIVLKPNMLAKTDPDKACTTHLPKLKTPQRCLPKLWWKRI